MQCVFEGGLDVVGFQSQVFHQLFHKLFGLGHAKAVVFIDTSQQFGVVPHGRTVGAPENAQRPARNFFAGIPLALAVMQQAGGCEALAQAQQ